MKKYDYFDVGNQVKIGSDEKFQDVLGVNLKEKTLLVNTYDYGLIWYEFGDVTDVHIVNNLLYAKRNEVERIIKCLDYAYPKGTAIYLVHMDERDMPTGLKGKVLFIDSTGNIHAQWDNGISGLGIVYGEDRICKIY